MTAPGIYTLESFAGSGQETWTVYAPYEHDDGTLWQDATVSGRVRIPDEVKTFLWGLGNKVEPLNDPNQQWFIDRYPNTPYWLINFIWLFGRNPIENRKRFIDGIADRNYTVRGEYPVLATAWDDCPSFVDEKTWQQTRTGYKRCVITLDNPSEPQRKFWSYVGPGIIPGMIVLSYSGTQWRGAHGLKYVVKKWPWQ